MHSVDRLRQLDIPGLEGFNALDPACDSLHFGSTEGACYRPSADTIKPAYVGVFLTELTVLFFRCGVAILVLLRRAKTTQPREANSDVDA